MSELEFEWREYHDDTAIHEAHHALCSYVCGGVDVVREIALMPAAYAEFGTLLNGYVDLDRDRLCKFDQLVVHVAGEVAAAAFEHRQPDWRSYRDDDDMGKARANVHEYFDFPISDFANTLYFQKAVAKAEAILNQYSLALTCLRLKLTRPPFRIDGPTFTSIMERCGVKTECD